MSVAHYWPINANDVYVRVFDTILNELDHSFLVRELISNYRSLGVESRYLVTRMYLRTAKWIRIDDFIKYMPKETLQSRVLPELEQKGWIMCNPPLRNVIKDIATQAELQLVCKNLGLKNSSSKSAHREELVKQLLQLEQQQSFFQSSKVALEIKAHIQVDSYYLKPDMRSFLADLELLFLYPMGPDASLDSLYLSSMKKWAFYPYKYHTQAEKPIFESEESCALYCKAKKLCTPILEASRATSVKNATRLELVAPAILECVNTGFVQATSDPRNHQAAYVYGRCLYDISQLFMKLHKFNEEYEYLLKYLAQTAHTSKRGVSLIRKLLLEVRFLEQTNTKGESSWLVSAVNTYYDAAEETSPIEKLDLKKKTAKLVSSIRNSGLKSALAFIPQGDAPLSSKIPVTVVVADTDKSAGSRKLRLVYDDGLNVEQLAMRHYEPFVGGHYEGSILLTIFWLVSLDVMFADPEYFRCAYQSHPMHLQRLISSNMVELEARFKDPKQHIARNRKHLLELGEPKPVVGSISWYIDNEVITDVVDCLGPRLSPLLMRICANYKVNCSGFPDLTLYNIETKQVKFVEVKSENDTISDNQQLWLEFLQAQGCDAEICKIISVETASKRRKLG